MLNIKIFIVGVALLSSVSACDDLATKDTLSLSERTVSIIVMDEIRISIEGEEFTLAELDGKLAQLALDCDCELNANLSFNALTSEESTPTSTLVAVIEELSTSNSIGSMTIVAVQRN